MVLLLLSLGVGLPLLLTFRSPRWRRTGRIVATIGFALSVLVLVAGVIGAGAIG